MGIENGRVLGTESVRVRALPRGGSGATGVGQRAGSAVVMTEPLSVQLIRRLLGSQGDGSLWRVPRGDAAALNAPKHRGVKIALLREGRGQESSELVEDLLADWLKGHN